MPVRRPLTAPYLVLALLGLPTLLGDDLEELEDYLEEYKVSKGSYGSPPCPLRQASIFRGVRQGVSGIFLEARGYGRGADGKPCEAGVGFKLGSPEEGTRCEEARGVLTCASSFTTLQVSFETLEDDTIIFRAGQRGAPLQATVLHLRRRLVVP